MFQKYEHIRLHLYKQDNPQPNRNQQDPRVRLFDEKLWDQIGTYRIPTKNRQNQKRKNDTVIETKKRVQ